MAKGPAEFALGPLFIGAVFNIILWGIMLTQVYLYFSTYKNDKRWMKCLVIFLFVADTFNSVFILVYIYDCLILNFGNVPHLLEDNWVFETSPALNGIIEGFVQSFFAWRVWVITGNRWIVSLIVVTSMTAMLTGIGTAIASYIVVDFANFVRFNSIVIIWLAASAVSDVCIATALTSHLRKHKTGFAITDDIIDRIIRVTVQTGGVTAVWAVVNLVLFVIETSIPNSVAYYLIFNIPLAKMYTNSLLSSLNSRGGWKFTMGGNDGMTGKDITTSRSKNDVITFNSTRPEVFVHVEHHEMYDVDAKRSPQNSYPDAASDDQDRDQKITSEV